MGLSTVRLHRKINVFNYLDFLFDDFYSNLNMLLADIKPKFYYDLNFFTSNIYLNKILSFSYWDYNYTHRILILISVNYVI